jgi:spore coat polysaccharide biosynthesis protein SpsF
MGRQWEIEDGENNMENHNMRGNNTHGRREVIVILQSRMGSTRLPGKMMMAIDGKPVIFHVLKQLQYSKAVTELIVATSIAPENDVLVEYVKSLGIKAYRGSENDVLSRYADIASKEGLEDNDLIVRITGDEPLIDPVIVDKVIAEHIHRNVDYTSTKEFSNGKLTNLLVKGVDLEVFSKKVLMEISHKSSTAYEKEHVTPYIYNHPDEYSTFSYGPDENLKNIIPEPKPILTLDNKEDFDIIADIIVHLYSENHPITLDRVLDYLGKKQ